MNTRIFVGFGITLLGLLCGPGCGTPPDTPGGQDANGGAGGMGGYGGMTASGGTGGMGEGGGMGICNDPSVPLILSPSNGATVSGGSVTFEWCGGCAPYEVEIAFDNAFNDPVMMPVMVNTPSVTVNGLNGGRVYWRVRSMGECSTGVFSEGGEAHLTCAPILLKTDPMYDYAPSAIAWNEKDKEYGVLLTRLDAGIVHIEFLRTDRLGNIVFGPAEVSSPLMPSFDWAGYLSPDLVYVASSDRWATVYHREGNDQSHVTVFDDNGTVLSSKGLDFGSDTEAHSITYHPETGQIVTSTDHSVSGLWETYIQRFDASLTQTGLSVNVVDSIGYPHNGLYGTVVAMPGLMNAGPSIFTVWEGWDSISPDDIFGLYGQRIDLPTGTLAWPSGFYMAGKKLIPNAGPNTYYSTSIAWNSTDQNLLLAYTYGPSRWAFNTDIQAAIVDPIGGTLLTVPVHLNTGVSGKAWGTMPKVAWDGEEFLVLWTDGRNAALGGEIRMTKLTGGGQILGGGDKLFAQPGWANRIHSWTPKAMVGHDGIHAFVYYREDVQGELHSAYLCIEPPY